MICVPDEIEQIDGFGWCLHWPCMEPELVVGDPIDSIRSHLCPDPDAACPEIEQQSQSPLRLVPDCRSDQEWPVRQSDHRPVGATTGGTSRPNRLTGEATQ